MGRVKYYKRMRLQAGNETTQRRFPSTSIIKDQIAKASYHANMLLWLDLQFSREIWAAKGLTSGENWLKFFSVVSEVEIKSLQRSERAHFLVSRLCCSILRSRALVLHREPARKLSLKWVQRLEGKLNIFKPSKERVRTYKEYAISREIATILAIAVDNAML